MSGGTRSMWEQADRLAREHGFRLRTSGKGHAKLVREGYRPITVPSSPRSRENALGFIAKALRNAQPLGGDR